MYFIFFIRLLEDERYQPDLTNPSPDEEKMKKALEEVEELKARRTCKVCLEREVSFFSWNIFYLLSYKVAVTFIPCAHLAACEPCALTLKVNLYIILVNYLFFVLLGFSMPNLQKKNPMSPSYICIKGVYIKYIFF